MVESSPSSVPTPLVRADVGAGAPEDAGSGRTMHVVALSSGLTQRLNEMGVVNRAEVARASR
jgi:hypothetical protein